MRRLIELGVLRAVIGIVRQSLYPTAKHPAPASVTPSQAGSSRERSGVTGMSVTDWIIASVAIIAALFLFFFERTR